MRLGFDIVKTVENRTSFESSVLNNVLLAGGLLGKVGVFFGDEVAFCSYISFAFVGHFKLACGEATTIMEYF